MYVAPERDELKINNIYMDVELIILIYFQNIIGIYTNFSNQIRILISAAPEMFAHCLEEDRMAMCR